jgi:hypothetical protein
MWCAATSASILANWFMWIRTSWLTSSAASAVVSVTTMSHGRAECDLDTSCSTARSMTHTFGYAEQLGDERADAAAAFLVRANAFFARLGITTQRVLTDNASRFRSHSWTTARADWAPASATPGRIVRRPMARSSASFAPCSVSACTRKYRLRPRADRRRRCVRVLLQCRPPAPRTEQPHAVSTPRALRTSVTNLLKEHT